MITNDRQYKIVKNQIENFKKSLDSIFLTSTAEVKDVHPLIIQAQKDAIQYQLNDLITQVNEYEDLKAGKIAVTEISSIEELPLSLIKARIANNLTQSELATKLDLKMQQIQRYEAERYETASVKTLLKIAKVLGIRIQGDVLIKEMHAPEKFDINNYPFKQMFQRGWFGNFSGTLNDAVLESKNLLETFFQGSFAMKTSLTKKNVRSGSTLNDYALEAWYTQVIKKSREQVLDVDFVVDNINDQWLEDLRLLSAYDDGPVKAGEYLKASGIKFVIESHLDGTFLDGAAIQIEKDKPIIALTLRHDRLDNFWFVLFHEIAHVKLHLSDKIYAIFDDLDTKSEGIEKEADDFSLNALIPNETWRKSLVRFNPTETTILNLAKSLKIHAALIAGRIRRETGKYFLFTELVEQGKVRNLFSNQLK
ncbi:XRE family transcriptional regulator [Agriterribacter humi]|uniref:XRE family transcriptional regulator n=1 Tax=Agriterribacter humi TaxID=1104781 RepID=UPI0012650836|nr:XRE family transcriptional regulator [Agriterribacter humi]